MDIAGLRQAHGYLSPPHMEKREKLQSTNCDLFGLVCPERNLRRAAHRAVMSTCARPSAAYAVTLVDNPKKLGPGGCPHPAQRELVLVDVAGGVVETPFVVPMLSSFVLTDVTWSARPQHIGGLPGTGTPFDPAPRVFLAIDRKLARRREPRRQRHGAGRPRVPDLCQRRAGIHHRQRLRDVRQPLRVSAAAG